MRPVATASRIGLQRGVAELEASRCDGLFDLGAPLWFQRRSGAGKRPASEVFTSVTMTSIVPFPGCGRGDHVRPPPLAPCGRCRPISPLTRVACLYASASPISARMAVFSAGVSGGCGLELAASGARALGPARAAKRRSLQRDHRRLGQRLHRS